jgi:hypothetical protein
VYAIREALVKLESLEFNAIKYIVVVAFIFSQNRVILEARIA